MTIGHHHDPPTEEVVTPNIDVLVKEGLELDQHYAFKFGSPSRLCLMSGRLPIHVNDANADPNVYNPSDPVSRFCWYTLKHDWTCRKNEAYCLCCSPGGQVGHWDSHVV